MFHLSTPCVFLPPGFLETDKIIFRLTFAVSRTLLSVCVSVCLIHPVEAFAVGDFRERCLHGVDRHIGSPVSAALGRLPQPGTQPLLQGKLSSIPPPSPPRPRAMATTPLNSTTVVVDDTSASLVYSGIWMTFVQSTLLYLHRKLTHLSLILQRRKRK